MEFFFQVFSTFWRTNKITFQFLKNKKTSSDSLLICEHFGESFLRINIAATFKKITNIFSILYRLLKKKKLVLRNSEDRIFLHLLFLSSRITVARYWENLFWACLDFPEKITFFLFFYLFEFEEINVFNFKYVELIELIFFSYLISLNYK